LYGPDIAGDQSYKDKSVDLKLRLREESAAGPELALGFRDVGGTGLFGSEYLVANKRWGNWDTSLGIGWGYLGARGSLKSPLAFLGDSYKSRAVGTGEGNTAGSDNAQSFFHGDAAFFGGVQWQTDDARWVLKAELDGNGYQRQPQDNNQPVSSPFNVGLVYRYSPTMDMSVGWERGNTAMFGLTLHSAFATMQTAKSLDRRLPPVITSSQTPPAHALAFERPSRHRPHSTPPARVRTMEARGSGPTALKASGGALSLRNLSMPRSSEPLCMSSRCGQNVAAHREPGAVLRTSR
jgi:hypothetical protein